MSFAHEQLKSIVERIERLEDDKAKVGEDIKQVYAEAKANGFDTKVLKSVIALRRMDPDKRAEMESLLDVYMVALGMTHDEEEE